MTRLVQLVLALVLVAPAVAVMGCESRVSIGARCVFDRECPSELFCAYGRCRAECAVDGDCREAGARCNAGVCARAEDGCMDREDCVDPLLSACAGSICAAPCGATTTCAGDAVCDDRLGACVPLRRQDAGPAQDAGQDEGSDAGPVDAGAMDAGPEDAGTEDAATAEDAGVIGPAERRLCLGLAHACVVREGRVYCWGSNFYGALGDSSGVDAPRTFSRPGPCGNDIDCSPRPERSVQAFDRTLGPLTDVRALSCGEDFTCALTGGGEVWCWGSAGAGNQLGHAGLGYVAERATTGAELLAAGRRHACVLGPDGARCWGENDVDTWDGTRYIDEPQDGRLGSLVEATRVATPASSEAFAGATDLVGGGLFTCTSRSGLARCVGYNEGRATGSVLLGNDPVGRDMTEIPAPVTDLSAGPAHACALAAGQIHCWGTDSSAVLARGGGTGMLDDCGGGAFCTERALPVVVDPALSRERFERLSRGYANTICAVTTSRGRVACWGDDTYGQAGIPPLRHDRVDSLRGYVQLASGADLEGVVEVECGAAFCCARTGDERVLCWGENDVGQLGRGTTDRTDLPTADAAATLPDAGSDWLPAFAHPEAVEVDFDAIVP